MELLLNEAFRQLRSEASEQPEPEPSWGGKMTPLFRKLLALALVSAVSCLTAALFE